MSATPEGAGGHQPDPLSHLRHELRTPINHILGYSELLKEELGDSGQTAYDGDLEKIHRAAESLLSLINANLTDEGLRALSDGAPLPDAEKAPGRESVCITGEEAQAAIAGRILVVDDNDENRETLCRRLRRQGHETGEAPHGLAALEALRAAAYDLVLLDVMMPEMDGYTALREMKADAALRHIPVIMISALDELGSVVRCIEAGAEDYLSKPFEPTLLRARIGASLEKKTLRDQEQKYLRTIEETQQRLGKELDEAANYVRSILPPPEAAPFRIDWRFIPSTELGGDSFGYHWLDQDHFAVYLLDVCGHGVGAALLSVAVINVLRNGSLAGNFHDPAAVLSLLNEAFPMERHNNMYFTLWYGVYHRPTRTLRHASGGHPPAFLHAPGQPMQKLREPGLVIGVMPEVEYRSGECVVPEGARLFVLSDGTYEVRCEGSMLPFERFEAFFEENGASSDVLDQLTHWIQGMHGSGPLDDDFSIVSFDF